MFKFINQGIKANKLFFIKPNNSAPCTTTFVSKHEVFIEVSKNQSKYARDIDGESSNEENV